MYTIASVLRAVAAAITEGLMALPHTTGALLTFINRGSNISILTPSNFSPREWVSGRKGDGYWYLVPKEPHKKLKSNSCGK